MSPALYTERQRAVATVLADVPGVNPYDYPIYMRAWVQRQWLGLDPKGVLFDPVGDELLFDFIRVRMDRDKPAALAWLRALPVGRQLEVVGELMLTAQCDDLELSYFLPTLWPTLGDEGRAWAPAYADRLLAFLADTRGGELFTARGAAIRATLLRDGDT